jgi:hypothetical protein
MYRAVPPRKRNAYVVTSTATSVAKVATLRSSACTRGGSRLPRTDDGPGGFITLNGEGAYSAQPQRTLTHGTLEGGTCGQRGHRPIPPLFRLREVQQGVQCAPPHPQGKGHVLVRDKRRHPQAVQGATALRTRALGIP